MDCYLKSIDYDIWYIAMHSDTIPRKKVDDRFVEKTHEDLDDKDKIMISKNAKAKNYYICCLDKNIYNSFDQASKAHEMWRMLEATHQGTSFMKEAKINILVQQYEMFKMHSNEAIAKIFSRFDIITNDLYTFGKLYISTKLVNKILRSLPKAYQSKVMAIREAMDLSKLPLEELMGSLMTHEIIMRDHDKDEEEDKKKKTIALKSSTQEEEELSDSELDDIALLTRRYKKYLRFKKGNNLKKYSKGNSSKRIP